MCISLHDWRLLRRTNEQGFCSNLHIFYCYSLRSDCVFCVLGSVSRSASPLRRVLRIQMGIRLGINVQEHQREAVLHYWVLLLLFLHRQPDSLQRPFGKIQVIYYTGTHKYYRNIQFKIKETIKAFIFKELAQKIEQKKSVNIESP